MKLLVDTSALLALAFRDDRNHEAAAAFVRARPEARLVLTELILSEVATRIRARAGAQRAVAAARSLFDSRRYELLFVDTDLVRAALDLMARRPSRSTPISETAATGWCLEEP